MRVFRVGFSVLAVAGSLFFASVSLAADYRSTVLADAPQGYWRLGETLGTTASDSSGNGNHGIYSGPSLGVAGALRLDPDPAARFVAGNTVNLGGGDPSKFGFSGRAPFSVELWVKPNTVDASFRTTVRKGVYPDRWALEISSQYGFSFLRTVGGVNLGPTQSAAGLRPVAGRWYHVVGTYDGTSIRLFVNGVRRGATVTDERALPASAAFAELGPYAVADLDEAALYPVALSKRQILAHYEAGVGSLGERRYASFEPFPLQARSELKVNVANGNLLVGASDVRIAGRGLDLLVARSYNSLSEELDDAGAGWIFDTGMDVSLDPEPDGTAIFRGPSGYRAVFTNRQPDGSYSAPAALDARLKETGGIYSLTWNQSDERLDFNSSGDLTKIVDRNGNRISFDSAGGRLTRITDTVNRALTVSSDAAGQITRIVDPSGREWLYAYSGSLLTTYTDPAGGVTGYEYDAANRLVKVTTPAGRQTRISYDERGRVATVERVYDTGSGAAHTTAFSYASDHTVVTDARGNQTRYYTEEPGRVWKVVDAKGNQTQTSYTSNSNVQQFTSALGNRSTNGYSTDGRENLLSSSSPAGAIRKWEYDAAVHPFQPKSSTDEQGAVYDYRYDAPGNLVEIKLRAAGQVVAGYSYNPDGTMASYTDARGKLTSYGYNALGQRTRTTYPAPLGAESYTYDSLGRLQTVTDGKGQLREYFYDALDRVTRIDHPGSSVSYGYDADGNRTSQADGVTTITSSYDTLGRVLTETRPLATTTYTWDSVGNLVSVADTGGTVSYGYDQLNLPTTVTEPGGKVTTLAYDNDYQPTTTSLPNGVVIARSYASGRPTRIASTKMSTVLASYDYTYTTITPAGETERDAALVKTVLDQDGNTTTYGYNPDQGFLTSAVKRNSSGQIVNGYEYAYAYDLMGNRTSETVAGVTTGSVFNDANQLTSRGTVTFSYDGNGNQLGSSAGAAYSYNAKNQSTSIKKAGGTAQTQTYAGASQFERVEKQDAGSTLTQFGESLLGTLIRAPAGGTTYYTRLPSGELLSQRTPTGTHYYLTDGLGTITAMTDDTGAVNARYSYDPYGQVLAESGPYNPWRFKSGYQSQTTDHYKFGHRWYDPNLGRWTQADPLESVTEPGDWNRYVYAANNPVNLEDPNGLWWTIAARWVASRVLRPAWNVARPAIGRAGLWAARTRIGRPLLGPGGHLNTGKLRIGVSRHQNRDIFSFRFKGRHFDFE